MLSVSREVTRKQAKRKLDAINLEREAVLSLSSCFFSRISFQDLCKLLPWSISGKGER